MRTLLLSILALAALGSPSSGQDAASSCAGMVYANHNHVDYGPLTVRAVSGRVVGEVGRPAKELSTLPACLGLFTEDSHVLVATGFADERGQFRFKSVPARRYRLIVRDLQNAFCVANVPPDIVKWPRGKNEPLVIHMRPTGLDDCSYGALKWSALYVALLCRGQSVVHPITHTTCGR